MHLRDFRRPDRGRGHRPADPHRRDVLFMASLTTKPQRSNIGTLWGDNVVSSESATRNLVYTSSDAASLRMQLSVGPLQQVVPTGSVSPVPGWPIISGTISFIGPFGPVSEPIKGGGGGQVLIQDGAVYGIGSQGPAIGGGLLYLSAPCIDGQPGFFINIPPNGMNITGISCTPWPPGGG